MGTSRKAHTADEWSMHLPAGCSRRTGHTLGHAWGRLTCEKGEAGQELFSSLRILVTFWENRGLTYY